MFSALTAKINQKNMEIIWHGKTCFTVNNKEASVVVNPHEGIEGLKADVVLSSLGAENLSEVKGSVKTLDWPGEYEVKGIPITATPFADTLIFYFEVGGVRMCHLGDIDRVQSNELLQEIGDIEVLMIPIGEGTKMDNKKANEIIETVEPKIIIPMGCESPAAALKSMGVDNIEPREKLEIKAKSEMPADHMEYVALSLSP